MSGWDQEHGTVSRAFDDWRLVEADIRAFWTLTTRWVQAAHSEAWASAESKARDIFDPERHDTDLAWDMYLGKVNQLPVDDHLWMVNSATIRDAVTAFEVYLEKSACEVVAPYGFAFTTVGEQESPSWYNLKVVHQHFRNNVDTHPVRGARNLRHLLTHQRGELRTAARRGEFAGEVLDDLKLGPFEVPLPSERVNQLLDDLAVAVRGYDANIWGIAYGSVHMSNLELLASGRNPPLARRVESSGPR